MTTPTAFTNPATECVHHKLSDQATPESSRSVITKALEQVKKQTSALQTATWGYKIEDPTTTLWFLTWDDVAAHTAYTKTTNYKIFAMELRPVSSDAAPEVFHAGFPSVDFLARAPVVEVVSVWPEAETSREDVAKGVDTLREVLEETARDKGYYGMSAGWVHEQEEKGGRLQVLVGWESKEAHLEWKAGLGKELEAKAMAVFRSGVKKVELCHVKLESRV